MALSLFDQFTSPTLYGVPLITLAFALPWIFFPLSSPRLQKNRLFTWLDLGLKNFTKQLFTPVNTGGHKWALLLTALMMYILTLNVLGLLPYTFTPTAQLSLNLALAFPLWLGTVLLGLRTQPTHALGHLLPEGTPTLLIPVLICIETISLLIRPLALGVRLTANLTAGHLLIQLTSLATYALMSLAPPVALLTAALLLMLTILEVAVAMIQAYVFILLLSLYLQENV